MTDVAADDRRRHRRPGVREHQRPVERACARSSRTRARSTCSASVSTKNPVDGKFHKIAVRVKTARHRGARAQGLLGAEHDRDREGESRRRPRPRPCRPISTHGRGQARAAARRAAARLWIGAALGGRRAAAGDGGVDAARRRPRPGDRDQASVAVSTKGRRRRSGVRERRSRRACVVVYGAGRARFRLNVAVRDAAGNILDDERAAV